MAYIVRDKHIPLFKDVKDVKRVIIERLKHHKQISIPISMLSSMEVDAYIDCAYQNIILSLEWFVNAKRDTKTTTTKKKIPKTWFDHWKLEKAPKWFIKLSPINYDEITVITVHEVTKMCPHMEVPDKRQHVEFLINE